MTLTPSERQQILRRLKHGPKLTREKLALYVERVTREVVSKREKVKK
jgi:hypothetical protein